MFWFRVSSISLARTRSRADYPYLQAVQQPSSSPAKSFEDIQYLNAPLLRKHSPGIGFVHESHVHRFSEHQRFVSSSPLHKSLLPG